MPLKFSRRVCVGPLPESPSQLSEGLAGHQFAALTAAQLACRIPKYAQVLGGRRTPLH